MDYQRRPPRRHPHHFDRREYQEPDQPVKITVCAAKGQTLLSPPGAPAAIKQKLADCADANGCQIIAYCIMPDHIHMLAFVAREGGNLLSFVHAFKRQSGFALTRLGKSAPVWQRDLWDRHTRSDADVEDAVDYILRNPVVAGLCEHPEDWPHSEFHGYPW